METQRFDPGIELLGAQFFLKISDARPPKVIHCRHDRNLLPGRKKEIRSGSEMHSRPFRGTYPQGEEKISVDIRQRKEL